MTKFSLFKKSLHLLCSNQYSHGDVLVVARYLSKECQNLLRLSGIIRYILFHEPGNIQQRLEDYSFDIIASLFARNGKGEFITLQNRFGGILDDRDERIIKEIDQILRMTIKKRMIDIYGVRDRIGNIFHRSIRYILEKKDGWEKSDTNIHGVSISKSGFCHHVATMEDVEQAFLISPKKSITAQLKIVLTDLVDNRKLIVPISYLLAAFREQVKNFIFNETFIHDSDNNSTDMDNSILKIIEESVNEVDKLILSKYESSKKLKKIVRSGYKKAIIQILEDTISPDGSVENYYYYLSNNLNFPISLEEYHVRYKKQFEYVVKKSKEIFSAIAKSGSNKLT